MALAAAALMGSCQASPSPAAPAGSMLATAADNGGVVKLASGQLLLVELLANPSTGEVWEMAFPPNELVIVPDGTRLVQTAAQASFEQEVRTQQLRFVAQAPGQTSLLLRYVRPQSPAADAPTFRLEVVVEAAR
jgi:inhibitor of cysteine peptidase